jgi:glycosyltransferase involved in cell wall biosynthesis
MVNKTGDHPMVEVEEILEHPVPAPNLGAHIAPCGPTLCLNMIVRQEARIIERCLTALVGVVHDYAILDTGSTDDTVAKIEAFSSLTGVTGREPFRNFEQARNAALNLARTTTCSHVLLLDADMVLVIVDRPKLDALLATPMPSVFQLVQCHQNFEYLNARIVATALLPESKYVGVTHEYLDCPPQYARVEVPKSVAYITDVSDGGCKHDKFARDIRLLSNAFADSGETHGNRARYCFYLAQSYRDFGNVEKAVEFYTLRANMTGTWVQEVCYSFFALLQMALAANDEPRALELVASMAATGVKRPEGYHALCSYYSKIGRHADAMKFLTLAHQNVPGAGESIPLFYDVSIAKHLLRYEATILFWYFGEGWWRLRAKQLCEDLLADESFPVHLRPVVLNNYKLHYKML